jgi:hypothetical protein
VLNRHFDIHVYNDHENEGKKTDGLQSYHKKHSHPNYNLISKTNVQDPIEIPAFLLTFLKKIGKFFFMV